MKTELEQLRIELQSEKEKIANIEARIKYLENESEHEKKKYPMQLIGIGSTNPLHKFEVGEGLKKYFLFAQLVETCKAWNRIDGYIPTWDTYDNQKWCVDNYTNKLSIESWYSTSHPICLKDYTTAQLFLDTFRTELEKVKDLL